jgi:hypothetical protein
MISLVTCSSDGEQPHSPVWSWGGDFVAVIGARYVSIAEDRVAAALDRDQVA